VHPPLPSGTKKEGGKRRGGDRNLPFSCNIKKLFGGRRRYAARRSEFSSVAGEKKKNPHYIFGTIKVCRKRKGGTTK